MPYAWKHTLLSLFDHGCVASHVAIDLPPPPPPCNLSNSEGQDDRSAFQSLLSIDWSLYTNACALHFGSHTFLSRLVWATLNNSIHTVCDISELE